MTLGAIALHSHRHLPSGCRLHRPRQLVHLLLSGERLQNGFTGGLMRCTKLIGRVLGHTIGHATGIGAIGALYQVIGVKPAGTGKGPAVDRAAAQTDQARDGVANEDGATDEAQAGDGAADEAQAGDGAATEADQAGSQAADEADQLGGRVG